MTAAKRKYANIMMKKLPTTLTSDDGVGKLFRTCRSHCKCSYAIYLTFAWKFTYELLSLQARFSDPLPPPYLYIVIMLQIGAWFFLLGRLVEAKMGQFQSRNRTVVWTVPIHTFL